MAKRGQFKAVYPIKHKSVPINTKLNSYKVPQNIIELSILITCVENLTIIVNKNFPSAFNKVSNYIAEHQADGIIMEKPPLTYQEAKTQLMALKADLEKLDKT